MLLKAVVRDSIICSWLLLMLVTLSPAQSGDGEDDEEFSFKPTTTFACESEVLHLNCLDDHIIRIVRANYGRFVLSVCNFKGITTGMDLQCQSVRSTQIVATRCDGHQTCDIPVNSNLFGDPCPGTSKYAEVQYRCEAVDPDLLSHGTASLPQLPGAELPERLRPSAPIPVMLRVCDHPTGKGTVMDFYWKMSSSSDPIRQFKLKYRHASSDEQDQEQVTEEEIRAVNLGDGKYSYTLKSRQGHLLYEYAIKAFSVNGWSEYSSYVSPEFCRTPDSAPETLSLEQIVSTTRSFVAGDETTKAVTCPRRYSNGVYWDPTPVNVVARATCPPYLEQGYMLYKCLSGGIWDPNGPETHNCFPPPFTNSRNTTAVPTTEHSVDVINPVHVEDIFRTPHLLNPKVTNEQTADHLIKNLTMHVSNNVLHDASELLDVAKNLTVLTETFTAEIQVLKDSEEKKIKALNFKESVLRIGNELLEGKHQRIWNALNVTQQKLAASSLLNSMENAGLLAASTMEIGTTSVSRFPNIIMKLLNVDLKNGQGVTLGDPNRNDHSASGFKSRVNHFTLPWSSLIKIAGHIKESVPVVLVVFGNLSDRLIPDVAVRKGTESTHINDQDTIEEGRTVRRIINSDVILASISRSPVYGLEEPILFIMEHKQSEAVGNAQCSFWDSASRVWSSEGCWVQATNKTHTVCMCTHLTTFAVLMDITGASSMLPAHARFSLEVITYVCCTLSIICLMLSWVTFAVFKSLDCDRNTIHKHLVFCLMIAQIVLVFGIQQTQPRVLCAIIAGVMHFCFLAAFSWMCLEGVQLYIMLIEVFESERSRVLWFYLFGYGVPGIIVITSAGIFPQGYGTESHCWLSTERSFIWSFVGPALVVMLVNIVMLTIAIYIMIRHSASSHTMRQKSVPQKIRTWVKGAAVLVVLLGLTWIFGVLYLDANTLVFAYIFTFLNSLQGLFIFVFHCLMNEKVQKEYRRMARHTSWLPDCVRIRYGGRSSTGSKENSSSGNIVSRFLRGKRNSNPGSSSSNSAKPFLNREQRCRSSFPSSSDGAASSHLSSDTSNNNVTVKNSRLSAVHSNGSTAYLRPPPDGILGDLSEIVDCSVVDSEFVTEYCQQNLRLGAETRRYSTSTEASAEIDEEEKMDRLEALSTESLSKRRCPYISNSDLTDEDGAGSAYEYSSDEDNTMKIVKKPLPESLPLMCCTESEKVLINNAINRPRDATLNKFPPNAYLKDGLMILEDLDSCDLTCVRSSAPDLKAKGGRVAVVNNSHLHSPEKEIFINSVPNLNHHIYGGEMPNGAYNHASQVVSSNVNRFGSGEHAPFSPFQFTASEC